MPARAARATGLIREVLTNGVVDWSFQTPRAVGPRG
jgi:hypothetical protein